MGTPYLVFAILEMNGMCTCRKEQKTAATGTYLTTFVGPRAHFEDGDMYLPFFLGVTTTTTMKLWTLAEISGELATAPQISSTPSNNLITLNLNDKSLCHLPYVFPFTFTDPSGSPWNALGTYMRASRPLHWNPNI
eukprot:scaffold4844_cov90-Skeletonema_dohrnii-CCMP3373.AAC.3